MFPRNAFLHFCCKFFPAATNLGQNFWLHPLASEAKACETTFDRKKLVRVPFIMIFLRWGRNSEEMVFALLTQLPWFESWI